MRDGDDRASARNAPDGCDDRGIGFMVEGRCSFVEHEEGGIAHEGARNGNALPLATGQQRAALADNRLVPFRQRCDKFVNLSRACGGLHGRRGSRLVAEPDVLADAAIEQEAFLEDDRDLPEERGAGDETDVVSVDPQRADVGVERPEQQIE